MQLTSNLCLRLKKIAAGDPLASNLAACRENRNKEMSLQDLCPIRGPQVLELHALDYIKSSGTVSEHSCQADFKW